MYYLDTRVATPFRSARERYTRCSKYYRVWFPSEVMCKKNFSLLKELDCRYVYLTFDRTKKKRSKSVQTGEIVVSCLNCDVKMNRTCDHNATTS